MPIDQYQYFAFCLSVLFFCHISSILLVTSRPGNTHPSHPPKHINRHVMAYVPPPQSRQTPVVSHPAKELHSNLVGVTTPSIPALPHPASAARHVMSRLRYSDKPASH